MLVGAFEDFLSSYKSTISPTDISAADALQDLNIDDGLSDEYDFMDDARDGEGKEKSSRPSKFADPKRKYMNMLQQVADRQISEVTIELDDLENVSRIQPASKVNVVLIKMGHSMKKAWAMTVYGW